MEQNILDLETYWNEIFPYYTFFMSSILDQIEVRYAHTKLYTGNYMIFFLLTFLRFLISSRLQVDRQKMNEVTPDNKLRNPKTTGRPKV